MAPQLALLLLLLLVAGEGGISALDTGSCIGPLGMESGRIADDDISASSSFEHASVGPHNARIRVDKNGGAWCPRNMIGRDANEWIQIDLKDVHVITGSETMGRFGNGQGVEFAEQYVLEYWRDRLGKWVRYRNIENQETLQGNENTYLAVKESLVPVILGSKVRFHPYSPHQRTICLRVEVYGCKMDGGLLSYSMPQGDKRGSSLELYDWNYDGEWVGGRLVNGLGALTDANLGPHDYKLGYYAKNRGWVGWRNDSRDHVEIIFEFSTVREFHSVALYCNNQFTRDVSVFKEIRVFFSVGGEIYSPDPVVFNPLQDNIFENPRNVSAKLHRRVGKFLKVELYFSAKWMMISEVSFDSTEARGSYFDREAAPANTSAGSTPAPNLETEINLMPVIVGALATIIILLAAAIFFIVSRSRNRKRWDNKTPAATEVALTSEKIALNPSEPVHYSFFTEGPVSDSSGSNSGSRNGGGGGAVSRKAPVFDDNYNSPALPSSFGTPRSPRTGTRGHTPASTPRLGGGPNHSATPQRRIINNPLAEVPLYAEPFHVMHNSHYPRALLETQETAILTDTSCGGDYSVPVPAESSGPLTAAASTRRVSNSPAAPPRNPTSQRLNPAAAVQRLTSARSRDDRRPTSESETSLDQDSDYVFFQDEEERLNVSESVQAMKARVESLTVYQVDPDTVVPIHQVSDGSFGSLYTAEARVPAYGQTGPATARLVAVKSAGQGAGEVERAEFIGEVRLLAALQHDNISRVLGVCESKLPFFVVMEYLHHGDLASFLKAHRPEEETPFQPEQYQQTSAKSLSFPSLIYIAVQISSGMKYLESLNFVHRDLAARNCLVGKAYHIKICDFGRDCVEYRGDYSDQGDGLLVPLRWMAWESVIQKRFTTKSDVWSFGVCMWEILTFARSRPHADLDDDELIGLLRARSVPPLQRPECCPKDLWELVEECWNLKDSLRPSFREIQLFLQRKNLGYSPV